MTLRILSAGLLYKNYTTGESVMLVLCSWDSTGSDLRTAKMCNLCVKMADDVTAQASPWAAGVLSSDDIKPVAEKINFVQAHRYLHGATADYNKLMKVPLL